ncbi:mytilin-1-like [Mytilus galloprovincialis]|uniref:mytilin-1-like n=1 Tax=Mytilus galloprovincialis TaxID=29158 RepID=UPI003F7BD779
MIAVYCWLVIVLGTSGTALVNDNDSNKLQNAKTIIAIADKLIEFHDHTTECVGEMMCLLAALPESKWNQRLNNPLGLLTKIATDNGQDDDSLLYAEARKLLADYPNIGHVLNGATNGHSAKDSDVCESMYSKCPYEPRDLLETVNDLGDITTLLSKNMFGKVIADAIELNNTQVGTNDRQKRSCDNKALKDSCSTLAVTCGLSSAGCAICGLFTFGLCLFGCAEPTVGVCESAFAGCTACT